MPVDYTQLSDGELTSLLTGSKNIAGEAFAELYQRHHIRLYNHCKYLIHNKTQAEDIYQMAWTRFYESVMRGTRITDALPFLFATVNNLYKNYLRDMKHMVSIEADGNGNLIDKLGKAERPDTIYEQSELIDLVKTALSMLDEEMREAYIMKKFDGLTFREISDVAGVSVECAKKRVSRAAEKIMKFLQPYIKDFSR